MIFLQNWTVFGHFDTSWMLQWNLLKGGANIEHFEQFFKHGFRNFSNKYLVEKSVVFVLFLFPWFINTDKYFGDCHSCPSVGPCCSQLSKAWVVLGFLFLSKRVEVCCQLRAENSSIAKEVEALDRVVWAATPSPSLVSWGLAWARVGCQGLKQRKRSWNIWTFQCFRFYPFHRSI